MGSGASGQHIAKEVISQSSAAELSAWVAGLTEESRTKLLNAVSTSQTAVDPASITSLATPDCQPVKRCVVSSGIRRSCSGDVGRPSLPDDLHQPRAARRSLSGSRAAAEEAGDGLRGAVSIPAPGGSEMDRGGVARPSFFAAAAAAAASGRRPLKKMHMLELFQKDLRRGQLAEALPPKPVAENILRVAQWNVNALRGLYSISEEDPENILHVVDSLAADILVLQEFCRAPEEVDEPKMAAGILAAGLRERGYQVFVSHVAYPTVLASRIEICGEVPSVPLYEEPVDWASARAALCAQICLSIGHRLTIYGTHFHHQNRPEGIRRHQAEVILQHRAASSSADATLIVGDFNQQRPCDYSSEEWGILAATKAQFGEPEDDGVCACFSEAGFSCVLDAMDADRNWSKDALPPPTHWTSTIIDYTFARGLVARGLYVVPLARVPAASDHLPLVCDWELPKEPVTTKTSESTA